MYGKSYEWRFKRAIFVYLDPVVRIEYGSLILFAQKVIECYVSKAKLNSLHDLKLY